LLKKPWAKWNNAAFTTSGVEYSSVRDERYRYIRYPDGSEELYDLHYDRDELNNIANKQDLSYIKEKLGKEIPSEWAPL
jgi:hypothetical protein